MVMHGLQRCAYRSTHKRAEYARNQKGIRLEIFCGRRPGKRRGHRHEQHASGGGGRQESPQRLAPATGCQCHESATTSAAARHASHASLRLVRTVATRSRCCPSLDSPLAANDTPGTSPADVARPHTSLLRDNLSKLGSPSPSRFPARKTRWTMRGTTSFLPSLPPAPALSRRRAFHRNAAQWPVAD